MSGRTLILAVVSLTAFTAVNFAGCGKDKRSTAPAKVEGIANELPNFAGKFRFIVERGFRSGPMILYGDTLGIDTMNACPGQFPLVGESRPEYGFTIGEERGVIADTMLDFTQEGMSLMYICYDDSCGTFDSCTAAFTTNISTRRTGLHPSADGFQAIATTMSQNCDGEWWESIARYTFERIGVADCSETAKIEHSTPPRPDSPPGPRVIHALRTVSTIIPHFVRPQAPALSTPRLHPELERTRASGEGE